MTADLDPTRIAAVADRLISARANGVAIDSLPPELVPVSTAEGEAIDDRVAATPGLTVFGWKVGCTSAHAQKLLGSDGPFSGRVYATHDSGVTLGPSDHIAEPALEGEFAFTLGADLAPRAEPYDRDEIVAALSDVRPAIEVVGGRFADFFSMPLNALIADAGANSCLVLGPPSPVPAADVLAATDATMTVDGAVTGQGSGADVYGNPLDALRWLVNHLSARGITLEQGQVVSTGTATQVSTLPAGSTATNTLAGIGAVSVTRS